MTGASFYGGGLVTKQYSFAVKYNGKYYPPNTPIVEKVVEKVEKSAASAEKPVDKATEPVAKPKKVKKDV